jgi:hypothetical protein
MRVIADLLEQDRDSVENNILLFEQFCQHENIRYHVHEENYHFKIEHLNTESRFAVLLIVNKRLYTGKKEKEPWEITVKQTLQHAECPVLLLPSNFKSVKRIAIAYDGRKESMFALKQFNYIFPQLSGLPTEMFT